MGPRRLQADVISDLKELFIVSSTFFHQSELKFSQGVLSHASVDILKTLREKISKTKQNVMCFRSFSCNTGT